MTNFTDRMLSDESVRRKLVDWAVETARGTDRVSAINACTRVCSTWRNAIIRDVIDRLEQQRRNDDSFVF